MATCAIAPGDKRALARDVGKHLTRLYGKRQNYSPTLVKASMRKLNFPDVWDCWALSLFTGIGDFNSYHAALGEVCDYAAMHGEMLTVVDAGSLLDFLSGDWSLSDLPDVSDLSSQH